MPGTVCRTLACGAPEWRPPHVCSHAARPEWRWPHVCSPARITGLRAVVAKCAVVHDKRTAPPHAPCHIVRFGRKCTKLDGDRSRTPDLEKGRRIDESTRLDVICLAVCTLPVISNVGSDERFLGCQDVVIFALSGPARASGFTELGLIEVLCSTIPIYRFGVDR